MVNGRRLFSAGAACGLCGLVVLAVNATKPSSIPDEVITEFWRLTSAIDSFYEQYRYYPETLGELQEHNWMQRDVSPQFNQWVYSPDNGQGTYVLRHPTYDTLYHIDPHDRAAVKEALASPVEFLRRQALSCLIVSSSAEDAELLAQVIRSDPSPDIRASAVFRVNMMRPKGAYSATEVRPILLDALLDPEYDVWEAASRMLVRSASEFVSGEMMTWATSEDRDRRLQCARALANLDAEVDWNLIAKFLEDPDAAVRISAAQLLMWRRRKAPRWFKEKLASVMREDEPEVRLWCARAGGDLGLVEALPILAESLREADSVDEILRSLYRLAGIDSEESRRILRPFLSHKDPKVREAAIWCLQRHRHPQRCADVSPLLDDPVPAVRLKAIEVIKSCTEDWVIPRLVERFEDKDGLVRAEAIMAFGGESTCFCPWHTTPTRLAGLKDPRTVKPLLKALNDPDYRARAAAALALSQYRLPETADALIASLTETAQWKHYGRACHHIGYALHKMGVEVPIERVRDFIFLAEPYESYTVIHTLIDDHPEKEKLEQLLHQEIPARLQSDDELTLTGALMALDLYPMPGVDGVAIELSRHRSSGVRRCAILALKNNRSPEWRERLSELLSDPNSDIRNLANVALRKIQRAEKRE